MKTLVFFKAFPCLIICKPLIPLIFLVRRCPGSRELCKGVEISPHSRVMPCSMLWVELDLASVAPKPLLWILPLLTCSQALHQAYNADV